MEYRNGAMEMQNGIDARVVRCGKDEIENTTDRNKLES